MSFQFSLTTCTKDRKDQFFESSDMIDQHHRAKMLDVGGKNRYLNIYLRLNASYESCHCGRVRIDRKRVDETPYCGRVNRAYSLLRKK